MFEQPFFMASPSKAELAVRIGLQKMSSKNAKFGFFPISLPGQGAALAKGNSNGNHWVLLAYDMGDNLWTYYNSRRPRSVATRDKYEEEARKVADFVHDIIKSQTEESNCFGAGYTPEGEINFLKVWDSPQQAANSVDCGFVVMMIMDALAKTGTAMEKISQAEIQKFKTNVICKLINSPEFKGVEEEEKELESMVKVAMDFAEEEVRKTETAAEAIKELEKIIDFFPVD